MLQVLSKYAELDGTTY